VSGGFPDGLFVIDRAPVAGYLDDEAPAAAGPTVVLVHGTLDRANSFRRTMRRLEDVRVVTYDRRGYQDSRGAEPPVDVQSHITDLLQVLRTVGGRPVVVGHSLGGLIALGAAIAEPERVAAVGAFEPPVRWIPVEGREDRPQWSSYEDPDEAVEAFFRRQVGGDAWDRLEPAAKADRLADGPALMADLSSVGETPLFDVTELSVPSVFGVGGLSDRYHKENVAWMVSHVAGARGTEIAESGHGAHLSHPNAFADFVRTVMGRAGTVDAVGTPSVGTDG
jgi:pimeloyl-ACP methyl ester carboxylesterase